MDPREIPPGASVPACFEAVADRYPRRLAVVSRSGSLAYSDLNIAASRLSARLREVGTAGDRVALLLRGDNLDLVAMLAVVKAARALVALNPRDPLPRLEQLVQDADPVALVTVHELAGAADRIAKGGTTIVRADEKAGERAATPLAAGLSKSLPSNFVYTSGSTGEPKAVVQTHGHLLRNAFAMAEVVDLTPDDRVVLLAAPWGGQGESTIWATLLAGATLLPFPVLDDGVTGLADWLITERITVYRSAASLFRHFVRTLSDATRFPNVRVVILSADRAVPGDLEACRRHFPNARLVGTMGMSETGNVAFAAFDGESAVGSGPLPVGRGFPGLDVRVVDPDGRECLPGEVGIVTVRTRTIAAGYWRDPDLTDKHFSFDGDGGGEFRSEDLAYVDERGQIVLVGRRDATYKIRGQRVDLGEVDKALCSLPGVEDAASVVVMGSSGGERLVGYVVADSGVSSSRVRTAARGRMARHLVPSVFVLLDALPRTANGKVDRTALRARVPSAGGTANPPQTDTERLLIRLWESAFDLSGLGRDENFLDLGGDSLIAAVIAAGIHDNTQVQLPLSAFIDRPRLSDLATVVDRRSAAPEKPDGLLSHKLPLGEPAPLSRLQIPFWVGSRTPIKSRRYTRTGILHFDGPLDVDILGDSLDRLTERHDILGTRFVEDGDEAIQIVVPSGATQLELRDFSDSQDPQAAVTSFALTESDWTFDLTAGPPLRFTLIKLGRNRHALVYTSHHIINDAPSWRVFLDDLGAIYEASIAGKAVDLRPLPIRYADFSAWQRDRWRTDSTRFQSAVDWWADRLTSGGGVAGQRGLDKYYRSSPAKRLGPEDWRYGWGIDGGDADRLDKVGRDESATFFMTRVAIAVPVLAGLIGHSKVLLGGVFTNRHRIEFDGMFGLFANAGLLVFDCDPGLSFRAFVQRVRAHILEVHEQSEVPFVDLVAGLRARGIDIPGPFLWLHTPTPFPPCRFADLDVWQQEPRLQSFSGGITLRFDRIDEQRGCTLGFDARIYSAEGMRDLADRLRRFASAAAGAPDASIGALMESA